MKKSFRYVRYGDTTLCTVSYENGVSHSSIGKHPDAKIAQKLAYKNLRAYIKRLSSQNLLAVRDDESIIWEVRDGKPVRTVQVKVNGLTVFDKEL